MTTENKEIKQIASDFLAKINYTKQTHSSKFTSVLATMGQVTSDMDEVAQLTWIAQEDAKKSENAADQGEKIAKQSILKMGSMRESIQESSKKIKRLGESSQEIGEVTGLIRDITKQINILALNAAIHAANTGEAGRAFAVVAQEVQRLALDSADATKTIEELINNIQKDAQGAISTMEKTTAEVVEGAHLTEMAGKALNEISETSKHLASIITKAADTLEEKSADMVSASRSITEISETSNTLIESISDMVETIHNS